MLVNNRHGKIIGAGSFTLLPGETGELPEGYDKDHPVIAFYFDKGYLVEVEFTNDEEQAEADAKAKAKMDAEAKAKIMAEEKRKSEEEAQTRLDAKLEAETKLREALASMSFEALQAEAKELGIKTTNKDTAETLIQKIVDKNQAE